MPYISSEAVKARRNELKKAFPQFKFSVSQSNHSKLNIQILSGPIQMTDKEDGSESVNEYYIKDTYKDKPQVRDILLRIMQIANTGNGTVVVDADYGTVPNFYVDIEIGKYNKPYVVTENKQKNTLIADLLKNEIFIFWSSNFEKRIVVDWNCKDAQLHVLRNEIIELVGEDFKYVRQLGNEPIQYKATQKGLIPYIANAVAA